MPWFKIDDTRAHHRKVMAAGNPAMGLWVRAGSYCAQQLTDGFISDEVLATMGTRSQAHRLVAAGLWQTVPGGFSFHDWTDYQPTRAEVSEAREREREKKRRWRERAGRATNGRYASTGDKTGDTPVSSPRESTGESTRESQGASTRTRPDPSRPVPSSSPLTPRSHAASLLGWQEEDDRLDHLETLFDTYSVRSKKAWLTTCHDNGELEDLLTRPTPNDDGWAHLPPVTPPGGAA